MIDTQIIPIDHDTTCALLYRSTAQCWYRLMPGIGWVVETAEGETLPPMTAEQLTAFFKQRSDAFERHYVI